MTAQAPRLPDEIIEAIKGEGRTPIAVRETNLKAILMIDEVASILVTHNHLVPQRHIEAAIKRLGEAKLRVTEDIRMCEEECQDNEEELADIGGKLIEAMAKLELEQQTTKQMAGELAAQGVEIEKMKRQLDTEKAAVSDRDFIIVQKEMIIYNMLKKINLFAAGRQVFTIEDFDYEEVTVAPPSEG